MFVDAYLRILHWDRRLPLNLDLGPLHLHLYSRSVFFLWVTVGLLAITGVAVLLSRKPELIRRWGSWMVIAPAFGIPIWLGPGPTAALAAVVAVIAVAEYARLVKLDRVDAALLLVLAVLYPVAAWLRPSLLGLVPIVILACALPSLFSSDIEQGGTRTTFTAFGSVWICWSLANLVLLTPDAYLVCFAVAVTDVAAWCGGERSAPPRLGAQAAVAVEPQQDDRWSGRRRHRSVPRAHVARHGHDRTARRGRVRQRARRPGRVDDRVRPGSRMPVPGFPASGSARPNRLAVAGPPTRLLPRMSRRRDAGVNERDSRVWSAIARLVGSPYGLLLAFVWGYAEALSWFIVAEMALILFAAAVPGG